jgi:hypothetical protein
LFPERPAFRTAQIGITRAGILAAADRAAAFFLDEPN